MDMVSDRYTKIYYTVANVQLTSLAGHTGCKQADRMGCKQADRMGCKQADRMGCKDQASLQASLPGDCRAVVVASSLAPVAGQIRPPPCRSCDSYR